MSLPQFDPEVTLQSFTVRGELAVADEFTATGQLQAELRSREDLRVLVSIWQTQADTTKGGSAAVIVARALGVGQQDPDQLKKWSAKVFMREGQFKEGSPATGLGLTVDNDGDPTGFETYTWTDRLLIKAP